MRQPHLFLGPALNPSPSPVALRATQLLGWALAGAALCQLVIWLVGAQAARFSPAFAYLLVAFDGHGNGLLAAVVLLAWLLRGKPAAQAAVEAIGGRPWVVAAVVFPLLCAGSLGVYRAHPVAMDEYLALFQSQAFAEGRVRGAFPPELLDVLIPPPFQNHFFIVARTSGEVYGSYWPGFALLLAPFAALGAPWAANPLLGALALPVLHRLAFMVSESPRVAAWAVVLALASPAFLVNALSFYSMPAHLLGNLLFAVLLLRPTVPRLLAAGVVGSLALTLHNPVPHLLFCLPWLAWLGTRPGGWRLLAALAAGYAPLTLLLGAGWHGHFPEFLTPRSAAAAGGAATAPAASWTLLDSLMANLKNAIVLPDGRILLARIAGLSKAWTWGAAGLLVLAAAGFWSARRDTAARLLAASLALTFFGYFLVRFDQGHGWGYRYLHSAWFVLPCFAALALDRGGDDLRRMAAWGALASLVLANALRLAQVDAFVGRHLAQVPPLARAAATDRPEVVFVDIHHGAYTVDLVQNHPLLRAPRVVMVYPGAAAAEAIMARHFPGYRRAVQGPWGEQWTKTAATAN